MTRDELNALYWSEFGRAGDEGGLNYWLSSGYGLEDIRNAFRNSAEYQQVHSAPNPFGGGAVAPNPFDGSSTLPGQPAYTPPPLTPVTPTYGPSPFDGTGTYDPPVSIGTPYTPPPNPFDGSSTLSGTPTAPNPFDGSSTLSGTPTTTSTGNPFGLNPNDPALAGLDLSHPGAYAGLNPSEQPGAWTGDGIWYDNSRRLNPDGTPWNGDVGSRFYGLPGATGPGGVPMGPPREQGTQADPNKALRDQLAALKAERARLEAELAGMTPGSGTGGTGAGGYVPRQGAWIPPGSYIDGNMGGTPANIPANYLLGSAALKAMGDLRHLGVPGPVNIGPSNLYPATPATPVLPAPMPMLPSPYGMSAPAAVPPSGPANPVIPAPT